MNFKTPFKVLTTAALIGTLSLSAVAPGAASASSTSTTQVGAKAATDLQSIILTKEGATPLVVTINEYNTAAALAALDDIDFSKEGLQGYAPASLVTEDEKAYNLAEYNTAVALAELDGPVDPEKIIAELTEVTKPENLTEGSFKDGALEIPESGDFKVTEIAAITQTLPAKKDQAISFTVNGDKTVTAADLIKEGYTVSFKFNKSLTGTGLTEAEVKAAKEEGIVNATKAPFKSDFTYAVEVTDEDGNKFGDATDFKKVTVKDAETAVSVEGVKLVEVQMQLTT